MVTPMTVDEIVAWSDTQWGWTDGVINSWRTYEREEREALARAAWDAAQGNLIVEIGTFGGLSTGILLQVARARGGMVWACDPFRWVGELAEPRLREVWDQFPDVPRLFVKGTSQELYDATYGPLPPERRTGDIDVLHIDGDHSVESVTLDCELWLPHVRSGGVVAFHDAHPPGPYDVNGQKLYGVADAFTHGWETLAHVGRNWCLVRRKP